MTTGENIFIIRMKGGDKFRARRPVSDEWTSRRGQTVTERSRRRFLDNLALEQGRLMASVGRDGSEVFNNGSLSINMADVSSISIVGGFVDQNDIEPGEKDVFFVVSSVSASVGRTVIGPYTAEELVKEHPTLGSIRRLTLDEMREANPALVGIADEKLNGVVMIRLDLTEDGEKFVVSAPSIHEKFIGGREPIPPQFIPTAVIYSGLDGKINVVIDLADTVRGLTVGEDSRAVLALCDENGVRTPPTKLFFERVRLTPLGERA